MKEKVPGDPMERDWPYMTHDTRENAAKAIRSIKRNFPDVLWRVVGDREKIREITTQPVPDGNVLIQITLPKGTSVDHAELMRTWSNSLNEAADIEPQKF